MMLMDYALLVMLLLTSAVQSHSHAPSTLDVSVTQEKLCNSFQNFIKSDALK